jgi:hypothetical protein
MSPLAGVVTLTPAILVRTRRYFVAFALVRQIAPTTHTVVKRGDGGLQPSERRLLLGATAFETR